MKLFPGIPILVLFAVIVCACTQAAPDSLKRLAAIDELLDRDPATAFDSLSLITSNGSSDKEKAYFGLLLTIAQHKNGAIPKNDSIIAFSREWFSIGNDYYNQARSLFYDGVVLYDNYLDDSLALCYLQHARHIVERYNVGSKRFKALLYSYLGKINSERELNFSEAIAYYSSAIDLESELGNARNLIIDYCNLIICQIQLNRQKEASAALISLDSLTLCHPDIRLNAPNNTKAIYYTHCYENLDSALFYIRKIRPSNSVAEGSRQLLLSTVFKRQHQLDSAVYYTQLALQNHPSSDRQTIHVYYHDLSDLYWQQGNADSSAHYARRAYEALHAQQDKRAEKRILELEKQYDVASRDAALERVRRSRDMALILLAFVAVVTALLFWNRRLLRQNLALSRDKAQKDAFAMSVVRAVVATYAGVNKKLTVIHNLPDGKRQDALGKFIQDNKAQMSANLLSALDESDLAIPESVRQIAALLDGAQQRTVFILTEAGFPPADIGKMLGISSNQVRTVKGTVRERIALSEWGRTREGRQLQTMRVGKPVDKKNQLTKAAEGQQTGQSVRYFLP